MAVIERLTPRLSPGLEEAPLRGGGFVLVDAARGAYVEISADELTLARRLDGETPLVAVAAASAERKGEPGFRRLLPLCRDLAAAGLLTLPSGQAWPPEWDVAPVAASGQRPWRLVLGLAALGRLCTGALSPWRRLPAAAVPTLALLLLLGGVVALGLGGGAAVLPEVELSAVAPHLDATFALVVWGGLGVLLTLRELLVAALAVAVGGRLAVAGPGLRWLVPVWVLDARDAARAGHRGRALAALTGLLGGALGVVLTALGAAALGASPAGYGLATSALLGAGYLLGHLCPLLPGDLGRLLAEMAPDDRFAPRLRSYLSRGMLRGMSSAALERRGVALRPDEERYYLLAALLAGLWTLAAMRALNGVSELVGDALLVPAVTDAGLPVAARGAAAALLAALSVLSALSVALAVAPPLLWVWSLVRPQRPRRSRVGTGAEPATPEELSRLPLFARLRGEPLSALAAACRIEHFRRGDVIVRQGDAGDAFYAVRAGDADVLFDDATGLRSRVATLSAGDAFGELALIEEGRRRATVRATTPLTVLRLTRLGFESALAAQGLAKAEVSELLRETQHLARLPFFADFSADALAELSLALAPHPVTAGEVVVREGDHGEHFFLVQSGRLEVRQGEDSVGSLGPGDCFGEIALLQRVPRTATVIATEPSHLLRLAEADFLRAVDSSFRFGEHVDALGARRYRALASSGRSGAS